MDCDRCGKCCAETCMQLSSQDIRRLEKLGHRVVDFATVKGGFYTLRNINGVCYFFDRNSKSCRIYANRPEGCEYYPIVYSLDEDKPVIDREVCKKASTISMEEVKSAAPKLAGLARRLVQEKKLAGGMALSLEEEAERNFLDGYNCAESVLHPFLDDWGRYFRLGVPISVATAFGGGIGRSGHICGAISGGLIAVGLAVGRTQAKDEDGKQEAYKAARQLLQSFKKRWGTFACKELTGCDLSTPLGYQRYRELKIHETKCVMIVKETTRTVARIIERIKKDPI